MIDVARGREDHGLAPVVLPHVGEEGLPLDSRDDLRGPENGPAKRLVGKCARLEAVEDDVGGIVPRLADLLDDHRSLARQFLVGEGRVQQDVRQDFDGQGERSRQDAEMVGGLLAPGIGVHVGPGGLNLLGDLPGRARGRSLERHVLQQVGNPVAVLRFVAGTGVHPDPHRGGAGAGDALAGDPETGWKRGHCRFRQGPVTVHGAGAAAAAARRRWSASRA